MNLGQPLPSSYTIKRLDEEGCGGKQQFKKKN